MRVRGLENVDRISELVERDAWLDLFDAAPNHVRESLGMASITTAGMGLLGCRAIPITELNRAMAVGMESLPSRNELDGVIAWLDTHAVSGALQIAPDARTPALRNYLDSAAFVETGAGWAKFVSTGSPRALEPISEAVAVEIVGEQRADLFGRTVTEGFGLPAVCSAWFATLPARPFWQCFVAFAEDEVAGGGAMFARDGAAWFGIEATLPAYRGRGVQRRIIAAQVSAAAAADATVLTCETARPTDRNDTGFSSYRNQKRAGLSHAYTRSNFKRSG